MTSWIEELERRARVARAGIDDLRRQIAELTEQVAVQEELLSRLEITREATRARPVPCATGVL